MIPPEIDTRIIKFVEQTDLKTSQNLPFEWVKHSFLLQPLADFSRVQAIRKCSQVGYSEAMILKTFYAAEHLGLNILYTLPTDNFLKDFVPSKVNMIIKNNNSVYHNISGGIYQKEVDSKFGTRFIFFQGTHNTESSSNQEASSKGVSITVDLKIHDEASKSDKFIIRQMKSRTTNSDYRGEWLLDNPVYPGMGADSKYQNSDQMHWMVQCSHCKYWQYLDWFRLDKFSFESGTHHCWIDPDKKVIECGKCRKHITDHDRILGKWIPKFKNKEEIRGYWINQLCYTQHNVASILAEENDPDMTSAYFNNMIMGKPYIGTDVQLNRSVILENMSSNINPLVNNVMGIDQGKTKWYVIGNEWGIFEIGKTDSWDEIEFLFNKYKCVNAVSDALPYQSDPKRLCLKYPGRFWRAFYQTASDQSTIARFHSLTSKNEKQRGVVSIRRNENFDELFDTIAKTELPIQAPLDQVDGNFIRHLTSLVRIVEEDKEGNQRFDWINTDQDHLAHALGYWKVAMLKSKVGVKIVNKKRVESRQKNPSAESISSSSYRVDLTKK